MIAYKCDNCGDVVEGCVPSSRLILDYSMMSLGQIEEFDFCGICTDGLIKSIAQPGPDEMR